MAEAHTHIRGDLARIMGSEGGHTRILYGGSVKAVERHELMGAPT